jgi:hypothetical protein
MVLKIILVLASAFALWWTIRTKIVFPAVITLGMIAGVLLTLFLSGTTIYPGIYVYMGFVALAFFYSLSVKELKVWPRVIIGLMSASIFTYWLWVTNHWHGNELLAPVFLLIIGSAGILSRAKLKNELGFLVILAADAIAIILERLMKAS